MRRTLRSAVGASAVALLVMVSVVLAIAPPAMAQTTPTVVVTPDVVAGGDPVDVQFSGFTEGPGGFGISTRVLVCSADAVGATTVSTTRCAPEAGSETYLPSGSFEAHPYGTFGDVNCALVAGGCVIGVVHVANENEIVAQAWDSIAFYPTLEGGHLTALDDGQTVTVTARVVPPGEWKIAQCGRAYVAEPTPLRASQLCGPSITASADAEATITADLVVHDPLVPTATGEPVQCGRQGCVLVVSNESVPVADSVEMSFGQLAVTVVPSSGLADVATVEVVVEDWPLEQGRTARIAQCTYPIRGALAAMPCGQASTVTLDDSGRGRTTFQVRTMLPIVSTQFQPGGFVDCRATPCAVGLFRSDNDNDNNVSSSGPLQFASPPLTVTPGSDLLDGQPMTVATSGLTPGQYRLDHCQGPRVPGAGFACAQAEGAPIAVGANGVLDVQLPARQRFTSTVGTHHYCGAVPFCVLRLWSVARSAYVAQRDYRMSRPNMWVSPNDGLRDGQSLQVNGNQLMSSYAGPGPASGGGSSGQWWLVQCNRNVSLFPAVGWSGEQYMWGLLLNCSVYSPPAVPVTVPGSTLQATVNVRARISNLLLQTTDCTTAPGACAVGLVRLEQDGTLTQALAPIVFAP